MSTIIDGKFVASQVKAEIAKEVRALNEKGINICLAVILVGNDPASQVYVKNKQKACEELGILSKQFILDETFGQDNLIALINELNSNQEINGILCQLPLPAGYDEQLITASISPLKDVDAFHPSNVGRLVSGDYAVLPCTPAGIIKLLAQYNIDIESKECVVVGRSNIVGKPISLLLLNSHGTVITAHSKTKDLPEVCRRADILVVAAGKPNFIKADMVKEGAVVIDVGINRVDGRLCGDVDFEEVKTKASYITPVPGGVGPMTIAMLMYNTVVVTKQQYKIS